MVQDQAAVGPAVADRPARTRGKDQKRRKKRVLYGESRCAAQTESGNRCQAARMQGSIYCLFHDQRKTEDPRAAGIPYAKAREVQWLLAETVEAVQKKRLGPKAGNTVGYLAGLLLHNQPRIGKEQEEESSAEFWAEAQQSFRQFFPPESEEPKRKTKRKPKRQPGVIDEAAAQRLESDEKQGAQNEC